MPTQALIANADPWLRILPGNNVAFLLSLSCANETSHYGELGRGVPETLRRSMASEYTSSNAFQRGPGP